MMEENRENPWGGYTSPPAPPRREYPVGGKELLFGLLILIASLLLCNFNLFGGYNLGFGIGMGLVLLCTGGYLLLSGCRLKPYSAILAGLCLVIAAGFGRSDDGFVKFVMVCFLFVGGNLAVTSLAGKNRRDPGSFATLADVFYTAFAHSFRLDGAFFGLRTAFRKSGTAAKKGGAIVAGLVIALPLMLIMIFLLMRADAAFEGLMDLLPDFELVELVPTVLFGGMLFCLLFARGLSLRHCTGEAPKKQERKGINALTVHTVLIAVCGVYLVYLFSQLAYFAGGLAGILPEGYTTAEYARRGFFEMAWLCAINLGIIGAAVGVVEKKKGTPVLTKVLCLFISVITVFFVAAASGKMFLYIGTYGLTRLRVLTQVIMLFLCLTTVLVAVWLFVPKLPYMKCVLVAALLIGAVVFWADVDTVVARYNVRGYLSGKLETVDVEHLASLNCSAIPYIDELSRKAPDQEVREMCNAILENWYYAPPEDFRGWNWAQYTAQPYLPAEAEGDTLG